MACVEITPEYRPALEGRRLRSFADFYEWAGREPIAIHASRDVARVDLGACHAYLKREHFVRVKDYVSSWRAGFGAVSKARREWQVLHLLRARHLPGPEPIAFGEDGGRTFLLVRELAGMLDLPAALTRSASVRERRTLARAVGRGVAELHGAGFSHPVLFAEHVFVGTGDGRVRFIDFQGTRVGRVAWRERWRSLAVLDASVAARRAGRRDRLTALLAYLRASGADPGRWLRLSLWMIALRRAHRVRRGRSRAR